MADGPFKMIVKGHLSRWSCAQSFKIVLKLHSKPASVGRAAEASSPANEAGFGSTTVRPKAALRGAGGAGAAGGCRSTEGRSTTASEQTRMACSRTATNSHAEKSGSGAGGAGAAGGRVVSGAAGRSTAASKQTRVM